MKSISWKYFIYNFLLGSATAITFYFAAWCRFNAIDFSLQKEFKIANSYNSLGSDMAIFGIFFLSIYFINLYWTFKKIFAEKVNKYDGISSFSLEQIVYFFYSNRIQKEIFEPITADWQKEYFEALSKKEIWKVRWINVRYTYAFIVAMFQKSPIGDLIELIGKLRK